MSGNQISPMSTPKKSKSRLNKKNTHDILTSVAVNGKARMSMEKMNRPVIAKSVRKAPRDVTIPSKRSSNLNSMKEPQESERYLCVHRKNMIDPHSNFRSVWDLFIAGLIIIQVLVVPFRLAFSPLVDSGSIWFWFDIAIDVLFFLDIFLNCFTGYVDETNDQIVVMDPKKSRTTLCEDGNCSRCGILYTY